MSTQFLIQSSDPVLFEKAWRVAEDFARPYMRAGIAGIVFLGAIARGYFDASADIDIAIFKEQAIEVSLPNKFLKIEDLDVQIWLSDYESELTIPWDMSKRWTYSQGHIHYDPSGNISRLLAEKVPLKAEERRWLLMSGLCLSEWYINRLTHLWIQRGNMVSAQHMFFQGLNSFFDLLFSLNNQLVADMKWRYYCAEKLERLPANFQERIREIMLLREFSMEELKRRQTAFMEMWREVLPIVEQEVGLTYSEIEALV